MWRNLVLMEIHTADGEPIGSIREICSGLTDKTPEFLESATSG
ncbi:hypothetical protein SynPROS91_02334 [Synechococcus sp. PROS-9-1]|nr:hypothetical protein SynPROS91_02334 [Synechococcus sp. PROS-9-1]